MITFKIDNRARLYPLNLLPAPVLKQINARLTFPNPAHQEGGWLNYQPPKLAGPSLTDLASVRGASSIAPELASSGIIGPVDEVPPLQPIYDLLQLRSAQTGKRFKDRYESDLQRAARAM